MVTTLRTWWVTWVAVLAGACNAVLGLDELPRGITGRAGAGGDATAGTGGTGGRGGSSASGGKGQGGTVAMAGEAGTGGMGGVPDPGSECPAATWDHDGDSTTACKPWRDCKPGTYVKTEGSASRDRSCEDCEDGTQTTQDNQSMCLDPKDCPAGTVQAAPATESGPATCEPCDAGTYCVGGTAPQVACASGAWDHDENPATTCVDWTSCPAGTSVSRTGSATRDRECEDCESGSYSSTANATDCEEWTTCGGGSYVSTTPSATRDRGCTSCPNGSFSASANTSECAVWMSCPAGTYVSAPGTAVSDRECTPCASGTYATGTNATSCSSCAAACSAANGTYQSTACTATTNRVCSSFPSCQDLANSCGPTANENCCRSPTVTGGSFTMGSSTSASVGTFALDRYEVTVGRFRKFVAAYSGPPAAGAGAHPLIAGSGWQTAWNSALPATSTALKSAVDCDQDRTWREPAGATESLPMNCVTWYLAFAFCAWDGGRLPTEAEWEYAAKGGSANRTYPWGSASPSSTYAVYACNGNGNTSDCVFADILRVGSKSSGEGLYKQLDLAGSMAEWTLDYHAALPSSCSNCANLTASATRVLRGGSWSETSMNLVSTYRFGLDPSWSIGASRGIRCARAQ